jgi:8-oxo-dGTP pyrophosphatase MutT (NUDIX family)
MEPQCGNCGKGGHIFHQCKMPIMSLGIVAFLYISNNQPTIAEGPLETLAEVPADAQVESQVEAQVESQVEAPAETSVEAQVEAQVEAPAETSVEGYRFLMIRRKDTLGFMDFMRGKYSIYNKEYILNLLNEMTVSEKKEILENDFDTLWKRLWCNQSGQYKSEEESSKEKFKILLAGVMTHTDSYSLADLVQESSTQWKEAEWGFPKGRRNLYEKDVECALREFSEETGYESSELIENLQPFEEIFMGSNYRCYKHKYFLMKMDASLYENTVTTTFDKSEVSKIEWKSYEECLACIRPYNLEKIRVIQDIYKTLLYCRGLCPPTT